MNRTQMSHCLISSSCVNTKQEQGNREGWKGAGRGEGLDREERSKEREGKKERIKWEG